MSSLLKMKVLKRSLVVLSLLSTLIIILGSYWIFELNTKIKTSLQTKKFLPPTEYYSAPKTIPKATADLNLIRRELQKRNYIEKDSPDRLRSQEYWIGPSEPCQKKIQNSSSDTTCLVFSIKENSDPSLHEINLQYLFFDADKILTAIHSGKDLKSSAAVLFEPELIAQYLGREPIQQKYTPLGQIPTSCLNGVLAIEDAKFLEHSGISYTGILRATIKNLAGGRFAQGGSTITQQLVKNYFLNSEKTIQRKVTEFFMSLILEFHAGKDEILETYLNIIYLGQNGPFQIRGFPAAAQYFFNQPIQNLEPDQCALLAAVLNNPGNYDPFRNPDRALKRRNLVLEKMKDYSFLSDIEAQSYSSRKLPNQKPNTVAETAPYFIDAVQKQLQRLEIDFMGNKVFTTLDLDAQSAAQNAVQAKLNQLESENKKINQIKQSGKLIEGLLVSADNATAEIRAIVGGRSYRMTQYNRAVDSHRQIGSIMKPIVFEAALRQDQSAHSWSPTTLLQDTRFTIEYDNQKWSPENYGKKYFGKVPMYFALKESLNCATASLGLEVGLDQIIETARLTGISSRLEKLPSLTLGSFELYPTEVLQSYLTLVNWGKYRELTTVKSVVDQKSNLVFKHELHEVQALDPQSTASLVSMMKQTVATGTARSALLANIPAPLAGKTGTTSDNKDSWFAGFSPYLTTVVWVGYDDNTPHGLTGASGALPIWVDYMKKVTPQIEYSDFLWPENTKKHEINDFEGSAKKVELIFQSGKNPDL